MSAQEAKQERGVAFGKYTLIAKLATGGMGEIFLARLSGMAGFEKLVVIKRLLPHLAEDSHFVAMLLDEARIAARLSHPNVCQVYDLGEVEGQYYIAMEYLEGVPISQMLQRARRQNDMLEIRMASALLAQSCEGLHHAHELKDKQGEEIGLVHRDVSPSNLFVTSAGVVKVLDFGVAKSQDALARTHTGALKGKYAYMSPEQVLTNPVDRRSDIFSLGIVMFELLTARRLFWRDSEYKMFQAIAEDEIPRVTRFRPEVPEAISNVVGRALSRDPDGRYTSAKDMAEDLSKAAAQLGGFATGAAVAEYVANNFDSMIQERRELVLTAVSSSASQKTAPTQAAKLRPHKPVVMRQKPNDQDSIDTDSGAGTAESPAQLTIDETEQIRAQPTGGGWRVVVGALLGVLVAGGAAFAYVAMQEEPEPEKSGPTTVVVEEGNVQPVDGTKIVSGEADKQPAAVTADAGDDPAASAPAPGAAAVPPARDERKGKDTNDDKVKDTGEDTEDKRRLPVSMALRKARPKWASCSRRYPIKSQENIEVSIAISVKANGNIGTVKVSPGSVRSHKVGKCLSSVAKGLKVRRKDGGVTVTQQLVLRPKPVEN